MSMLENVKQFSINRSLLPIEKTAIEILKKLQNNGFEAYFAGGAVRDELLGNVFHDIDIATSAKPEDVKKMFENSYDRGKSFGVVAVKSGDFEFEVATFRKDIGIADHRRPKTVEYSSSQEDAKRRDFTVNGLFYDPISQKIFDYVGGLNDLENKTIRFIGDPKERIDEDYLRMLRAVRFACKLNFQIEESSLKAIKANCFHINQISIERIREELSKILLLEQRVRGIELLDETGLLEQILPELQNGKNVPQPEQFHAEGDVWTHTMLALENIGKTSDEQLVWTVLLHDIAKPETIAYKNRKGEDKITFYEHDVKSAQKAQEILERFKFSHHFIQAVVWAILQHMRIVSAFRGMSERKQKQMFLNTNAQLLLDLTKADLSASLRTNGKPEMDMYQDACILKEKYDKEKSQEINQLKKFDLVTGQDIMEILKMPSGPKVGQIKDEIEKKYLDGEINNRKQALEFIERFK